MVVLISRPPLFAILVCMLLCTAEKSAADFTGMLAAWEEGRAEISTGRITYWKCEATNPTQLSVERLSEMLSLAAADPDSMSAFGRMVTSLGDEGASELALSGRRFFVFDGGGRSVNKHNGYEEYQLDVGPILRHSPKVAKSDGRESFQFDIGVGNAAPVMQYTIDDFCFTPDPQHIKQLSLQVEDEHAVEYSFTLKSGQQGHVLVDKVQNSIQEWILYHKAGRGSVYRARLQRGFFDAQGVSVPRFAIDVQYGGKGEIRWVDLYLIERCELNVRVDGDLSIPVASPSDVVVDYRVDGGAVHRVLRKGQVTDKGIYQGGLESQNLGGEVRESAMRFYAMLATAFVIVILAIALYVQRSRET